ncbi:MAG: DsbA family protein [Pseudomonadota bacterium]
MLKSLPRACFYAVLSGAALALAACGGEPGSDTEEAGASETIDTTNKGALSEMALGAPDAPVTVIEYASITCPHCATFHERVFPTIKKDYIETGKVRFVFREFPTAPAELSVVGSMLARCAADKGGQDAYFLVLGSLFQTQQKWIYGETRDELMKIAAQAGLDQSDFDACVRRQELIDLINGNVDAAVEKYRINSTPSFVINGTLRNFSTVEAMSEALDEALARAEG